MNNNTNKYALVLASSVLSLRGGKSQVTAQPLFDETSGNILMWNGEIFGSDLFCVGSEENDAQRLLEELSKENTTTNTDSAIESNRILNILKSVRGPYAFLFYHHKSKCIYFGRDRLGRRSLLISLSNNTNENEAGNRPRRPLLALSSVKCEPKVKDSNESNEWLFKEMNEFEELKANGIYKLDLNEFEKQTLPFICLYEWKKVRQGCFNLRILTINIIFFLNKSSINLRM
jgi:asparagine synthetase B (glutamine-hydrolysing)